VGDSKASGTVLYKKTPSGMPLLKIRAEGLKPISGEEKYVIWQISSRHDMVPIAGYQVGSDGKLDVNLKAGFESLAFLEDGSRTELLISYVDVDDRWRNALGQGPTHTTYDPGVPGRFILRGPFTGSLVGASE